MLLAVSFLAGWVGFDLILVGYSRGMDTSSGFPGGQLNFSDLIMGKWAPSNGSGAPSAGSSGVPGTPGVAPYDPYSPTPLSPGGTAPGTVTA